MANANIATGLRPIRDNGTPWSGQLRTAFIPAAQASNIFIGDPIVALGGGDAFGVPAVGIATAGAGNAVLGAVCGIVNGPAGSGVTITRDLPIYRQASIASYVLITDDPDQLYALQEDSSGGAIAAATAGFANGNLVAGAGNITTGASGWQLQSSSVSSSANTTYQLKLLELLRGPDNALGVNAKWVVKLNNPQFSSNTGV